MDPDRTLAATETEDDDTRPGPATSTKPLRGTVMGRYLLLDRLGAGGMGVVHAAYDPELDRKIALKLIKPRTGGRADGDRARLLREAQALARLSHPNVVTIHDVGTHGELVWIAMEFVAGKTLRAWARARAPAWPELLRVLTDVAHGVAAAHAAGLVHRDLKPDNVMVGDDGRVRVMDFGLAHQRAPADADAERTGETAVLGADDRDDVDDPVQQPELAALSLHLTRAGAIQGTPAYMAPEQWKGQEAEAATDQFGWAVMSWELLHGERPFAGETAVEHATAVLSGQRRPPPRGRRVPGWLRRVIERGLATEPAQRWPTMAALVVQLERGRARARWRIAAAVVTGVAVLAAAVEGQRRWVIAQQVAACEAAGAVIDDAWNETAEVHLRAAFEATKLSYAATTADKVVPWLDERAAGWRRARTDACLNVEVRGAWSEDTYDRASWCLEDQQLRLASLVEELGREATAVQKAVTAVSGLDPADACMDEDLLQRQPMPPADARGRVREIREVLWKSDSLNLAGSRERALELVRQARVQAEEVGWTPLWAGARAREGQLLQLTGRYEEAETASAEAYFAAAHAGAWVEAAYAATTSINIVGRNLVRPAEGRRWAEHAELAIAHAGDPIGLQEASRLRVLGNLHWAEAAYATARELNERALAIQERALGPDHPDVAKTVEDLAIVHETTGDYERARQLYERALAIRTAQLGPDHPDIASSLANLADLHAAMGKHAEARSLYERTLAIQEPALGPDHPSVANTLNNLGSVYRVLGELARAREVLERALAIWEKKLDPGHPSIAHALNNLGTVYEHANENEAARALYERALAIWEKTSPGHPDAAGVLTNLANVHQATGSFTTARALHERALALKEKTLGPDHPRIAVSLVQLGRLLNDVGTPQEAVPLLERAAVILDAQPGPQNGEHEAHLFLGMALWAAGGDRARALAEVRKVRDGLRDAGPGHARTLADAEQWLAKHEGDP